MDQQRVWQSGKTIWAWDKNKPNENWEEALRRIKGSQCLAFNEEGIINDELWLASVTGRRDKCSIIIRTRPKENQEIRQFADHE
jgi:hypothetical protein